MYALLCSCATEVKLVDYIKKLLPIIDVM